MKKLILGLTLVLSTCMQPVSANSFAIANMMNAAKQQEKQEQQIKKIEKDYNSPMCIFSAEANDKDLRALAQAILVPNIDKNRAMTVEDYSIKDTLVAVQMVLCEGKTPQQAVNFVDPD